MPQIKNILLVNPWIYDFSAFDFWMRPLGLLTLASVIKKNTSFRLNFIDCLDRFHSAAPPALTTRPDGRGKYQKEEVPKPNVLRDIPRRYSRYGIPVELFKEELEKIPSPDAVVLTCLMTYWYPGAQLAVECIRDIYGRVPIVLGGVYATLLPDHARSFSGADLIIPGPGERSILRALKEVMDDTSFSGISLERHETVPSPAYEFLGNTDVLPLLTSRGCPFKCSYCASRQLYDGFERRSVASVVAEIEKDVRTFGAKNIAFYDDSLLLEKARHIIPILREVAEKNFPLVFHTPNGLHVKEIDRVTAALLRKARVETLFLSQESFSGQVLESSCSKVGSGDLAWALENLERAGYVRGNINVYLLVGLPEQDASTVRRDILQVLQLGARPRLALFSPVPGTMEWKKLVARGYLNESEDPLLHNKDVFPYKWGRINPEELASLKMLSRRTPDRILP